MGRALPDIDDRRLVSVGNRSAVAKRRYDWRGRWSVLRGARACAGLYGRAGSNGAGEDVMSRKQPKIYFSHWTAEAGPGFQMLEYDYPVSWEHWREWRRACERGEALPASDFPNPLWTKAIYKNKQPRDALRGGGGAPIVSARFRAVLERFDLGETVFYPVTILKKNRKDQYEGDFFYVNIRALKNTLLVDESYAATMKGQEDDFMPPKLFRYSIAGPGSDDDYRNAPERSILFLNRTRSDAKLILSADALGGPDLWFEQRLGSQAVFFSEPLHDAIKAAEIKPMTCYKVKIRRDEVTG
ncbi:MAG: DUF1629 domain-containing protein [Pseudomonadota bacterium]